MNPEINAIEILLTLVVEILFGVGFNALVAWAHENKLWHVSVSVAVGVAGTIIVPAVMWFGVDLLYRQRGADDRGKHAALGAGAQGSEEAQAVAECGLAGEGRGGDGAFEAGA